MDFQSAKNYLDSFISYEITRDFQYGERDFDLGRLRDFFEKNEIEYSKLKYVHVAGSKGKGTVASLTANYMKEKGLKVGLFTSPHIVSLTERFWFDGENISEDGFGELVGRLEHILEVKDWGLTYFELLFVIAVMFFIEVEVDYAVLEVGLGGRLDATNIVLPEVSVLTLMEKEHTDVLGEDIESILNEKLGVKKEGIPFVVGKQSEKVRELIEGKIHDSIFVEGEEGNVDIVREVVRVLFGEVDEGILVSVVDNFKMPGRFDVREIKGKTVVFDMAHTQNSIKYLLNSLNDRFSGRLFVFLVSIMRDKDADKMLSLIEEKADRLILTSSHEKRGFLAGELGEKSNGEVVEDAWEAFELAFGSLKRDQVLVVTGSHFLIGKLFEKLRLF